MNERKQMRAPQFVREYDIPRSTFERLRHRADDPLPSYKIGRSVYIDIPKFERWREREDSRQSR